MRNYSNIVAKLQEPLLITPQRHSALCQLLEARMSASANNPRVDMEDGDGPDNDDDKELRTEGDTVIIPVHGTLVAHPEDIAMSECGCAMEDLNNMISQAEDDPRIKRVIYDFRTPGGVVTMIPETARRIRNSNKETIAFTDSECCSGGIWLASQCSQFYATPSSRVGSVGVFCMGFDLSRQLEKNGVRVSVVEAGKFKTLGGYWKPLTDEERAILQARVDKIYSEFKGAMENQRVVEDKNFGNGLVFDGQDAVNIGFCDGCYDSMADMIDELE